MVAPILTPFMHKIVIQAKKNLANFMSVPPTNGVPFRLYTKGRVIKLASRVNLRIVVQSRNGIRDRVMYPFYIGNLRSKLFP